MEFKKKSFPSFFPTTFLVLFSVYPFWVTWSGLSEKGFAGMVVVKTTEPDKNFCPTTWQRRRHMSLTIVCEGQIRP